MFDSEVGKKAVQNLRSKYCLGIWGHTAKYPDKKIHANKLISDFDVDFVNTDLPRSFT